MAVNGSASDCVSQLTTRVRPPAFFLRIVAIDIEGKVTCQSRAP